MLKRITDFRIINEANIHVEWELHRQLIPESKVDKLTFS